MSGDPGLATVLLAGEPPAGYQDRDDGNRLGDTPARADDYSRLDAQLASETTGTPHINDVGRRVRYNGAYFEIDVEVSGERGIVPVTWDMLRAHTPLVSQAYYARVYTSRGWSNGRQVPGFGPDVILPEAFTPELTPVLFEYVKRAFVSWNRDFDGWTQEMANAWMKEAAIHVARVWTPEYVGGVAVASARASQITGRMALGAAAVPNAGAATRACAGGRCPWVPYGFTSAQQAASAVARFRAAAAVDDVVVGIRGSAATGVGHHGGSFNAASDIDFFIVSDTLFKQGLAAGARGSAGALRVSATQRFFPALHAVEKQLSSELGRKTTIRIFSSEGFNAVRTGTEILY